jgi:hypothetical protein
VLQLAPQFVYPLYGSFTGIGCIKKRQLHRWLLRSG